MINLIKYNVPRHLFYIRKPKKILLKKKLYIKKMLSYYYSISKTKEINQLIKYSNTTTALSTINNVKNFINVLESKLSIFIVRIGFVSNSNESQSVITRGNIIVNGKIIYKPSYNLKKGDIIQFNNFYIKQLKYKKNINKKFKNN